LEGECPICSELSDGHFGHLRFKIFVNFDFDGHLEWGHCVWALCGGL
jgi:hypothetical protein